MNDAEQIVETLLAEWELARLEGRELSADEVARQHPELVGQVRDGIEVLKVTSWVFDELLDQTELQDERRDKNGLGSRVAMSLPQTDCGSDEFLQMLSDAQLIEENRLDAFRQKLLPGKDEPSARPLAKQLVSEGLLTFYQAKTLLTQGASPLLLDRYIILDVLGSGGMGFVFKALHRSMERVVALKILPRDAVDSAAKVARFQQEIKASAKLNHPNIVAAHDAHEVDGTHFLVMEYVPGKNLNEHVEQHGALLADQAATIIAIIADALGSAHQRGIIHRDVKPSNILLSDHGVPKLLDLGLARIKQLADVEKSDAGITLDGIPMGTAAYISPEQARDSANVDGRADIYSLGCTLYFLLTGKPVFEKTSSVQVIMAHLSEQPISLTSACPGISAELSAVFERMVAKEPGDRFASMKEVATALRATGFVDAQRMTQSKFPARLGGDLLPTRRRSQRRGWLGAVSGGLALATLLGLIAWISMRKTASPSAATDLAPDNSTTNSVVSQRDVARWVLQSGGTITAETAFGEQFLEDSGALPDGHFDITMIELFGLEGSVDLGLLRQLPKLHRLTLAGFQRHQLSLEALPTLRRVTELELDDCSLVDDDLLTIAEMLQLRHLDVGDNPLTDRALAHLARLTQLEYLSVADTKITDQGLATLTSLEQLSCLRLDGCPVTIAGLVNLQALENLTELSLTNVELDDEGVTETFKLDRLRILNLSDNEVGANTLAQLSNWPNLEELRLTDVELSEELVTSIARLRNLRRLDLRRTVLNDAWLYRLAKLQRLIELFVQDTDITGPGVERFQDAKPNCNVYVSDEDEDEEFEGDDEEDERE